MNSGKRQVRGHFNPGDRDKGIAKTVAEILLENLGNVLENEPGIFVLSFGFHN